MRRRVWLNKPGNHSSAFIYAEVRKGSHVLKIADCDRTVSLDIDGYNEDSKANTLFKIDTLIAVLTQFRAAVAEDFKKKSRD